MLAELRLVAFAIKQAPRQDGAFSGMPPIPNTTFFMLGARRLSEVMQQCRPVEQILYGRA
jgi:hypothetical protein